MIVPMQYNKFGYQYLSKIAGYRNSFHPGVDLNFTIKSGNDDLGMRVNAAATGMVVFARNEGWGWGNLLVIYHPQLNCWTRYAHLKVINVKVGDTVVCGDQVGECGKSGTVSPHLHFEVIIKELLKWTNYPYYWGVAKTRLFFADPLAFINANASIS